MNGKWIVAAILMVGTAWGQGPCPSMPPKPVLTASLNDGGGLSFSIGCPERWKAVVEPEAMAEFNAKKDRNVADSVNLLANHVSCVALESKPKEERK